MGTQYFATVTAEVPQVVRCAHCREEFLYLMRKTGSGMVEPMFDFNAAKSQRQAAELARQDLDRQLTVDNFNVVPCRHCYHYQPFMRERAAKLKVGSNRHIGCVLVALSVIPLGVGVAMLFTPQTRDTGLAVTGVASLCMLLSVGLHWGIRRYLATYDPNSQRLARRRNLAEERCMTWDEFNRGQVGRLAREYQEHVQTQKRGRWAGKVENREPPPPPALWLPSAAFVSGLAVPLRLGPGVEAAVQVEPDTEPGTVVDLVPGESNTFPFRVRLLAVNDYYNDPLLDDEPAES